MEVNRQTEQITVKGIENFRNRNARKAAQLKLKAREQQNMYLQRAALAKLTTAHSRLDVVAQSLYGPG